MQKKGLKDFFILSFATIGLFLLLWVGYFTSETYDMQKNYINASIIFASVIFITSSVILVATYGFKSFPYFILILLVMSFLLYGIWGVIYVFILSYITWGFAFSIELLLINSSKNAINWFKKRYTKRSFSIEYRLFFPMLWFLHLILEQIPSFFIKEPLIEFNPKKMYEKVMSELNR